MVDLLALQDRRYCLAEAAILAEPWLSALTLPDALARTAVLTGPFEPREAVLQKVVIKTQGPERSVQIYATGPMPPSFVQGLQGVVDLLGLPAGWNSYSAKPIAPQNAVRAIRLLAEFLEPKTPTPVVVPTVRGGIQLEWHTKRTNIEIYIESSDVVSFFAEELGSNNSSEKSLSGHEHELRLWLKRLSEK